MEAKRGSSVHHLRRGSIHSDQKKRIVIITLKIGRYAFGSAFLLKLAFILFLIGIHIGAYLAARSEGERFGHVAFLGMYVVVIPLIVKRMKNDVKRVK